MKNIFFYLFLFVCISGCSNEKYAHHLIVENCLTGAKDTIVYFSAEGSPTYHIQTYHYKRGVSDLPCLKESGFFGRIIRFNVCGFEVIKHSRSK